MFRNPRENLARVEEDRLLPSTGRAPTPPPTTESTSTAVKSQFFASAGPEKPRTPTSRMPVLGVIPQTKISIAKKNAVKQNQSILSFFAKTEKDNGTQNGDTGAGLFFQEDTPQNPAVDETAHDVQTSPDVLWKQEESPRYNELETPVKRRRLDRGGSPTGSLLFSPTASQSTPAKAAEVADLEVVEKKPTKHRGGFVDDSSDDEGDQDVGPRSTSAVDTNTKASPDRGTSELSPDQQYQDMNEPFSANSSKSQNDMEREESYAEVLEETKVPLKPPDDGEDESKRPPLARHGTSGFQVDEFGPEDFDDEFFPEGEEFIERQYMEEQLAMERDFEDDSRSERGTSGPPTPRIQETEVEPGAAVAACPICNGIMKGMSETEASAHVNSCLDGTAKPLPQPNASKHEPGTSIKIEPETLVKTEPSDPSGQTFNPIHGSKRFLKTSIARPAQSNPFASVHTSNKQSAFSQLMSGHAEDRAWAEAAHNELTSRGKPAYTRTCPFYKIMPGLYICVDAFRYGKVEGQSAYFLSHFHSDHYIGLTSSWSHGPIYASKISCNLMRQQLRVDSKWLVPLEFEKKVEVPNTKGVFVTMIPANHCPGSSLFLFEKVVGKQKDGSPKLIRILHCGDFRACPAHIHHPLLKPEVMDAVTGQTKNQVIDTCYLDTTYLTPKYAFPSQSDVIDACAQMCVSLSKDIVDTDDAWERTKVERAGSQMKKFLETAPSAETSPVTTTKTQRLLGAGGDDEESLDIKPKMRGKLLVVCGTYSIGKERICLGIARALGSKIFAPPAKMRICRALEDAELNALLTPNPLEAQVHMQMLMEIRAETLHDYLVSYKPHFSRVVGFRPTGWSYRPPSSRMTDNPLVSTVLHSESWKSRFMMKDLVPQRGSTRESHCFGVPYSEHSSFRELTMFVCALRIGRVIPTVNVGSAKSREKMKGWIERWEAEKKKNGLFRVENIQEGWGSGDGQLRYGV